MRWAWVPGALGILFVGAWYAFGQGKGSDALDFVAVIGLILVLTSVSILVAIGIERLGQPVPPKRLRPPSTPRGPALQPLSPAKRGGSLACALLTVSVGTWNVLWCLRSAVMHTPLVVWVGGGHAGGMIALAPGSAGGHGVPPGDLEWWMVLTLGVLWSGLGGAVLVASRRSQASSDAPLAVAPEPKPSPASQPSPAVLAQYAAMRRRHVWLAAGLVAYLLAMYAWVGRLSAVHEWYVLYLLVAVPVGGGFLAMIHNARCPSCRHVIFSGRRCGWSSECPFCGVSFR